MDPRVSRSGFPVGLAPKLRNVELSDHLDADPDDEGAEQQQLHDGSSSSSPILEVAWVDGDERFRRVPSYLATTSVLQPLQEETSSWEEGDPSPEVPGGGLRTEVSRNPRQEEDVSCDPRIRAREQAVASLLPAWIRCEEKEFSHDEENRDKYTVHRRPRYTVILSTSGVASILVHLGVS